MLLRPSANDISAALSVSFLSVAAGSAFGLWTGVGALVGILSMALASIFGGFLGGMAVKTSGPTGSTAAVMFAATAGLAMAVAEVDSSALVGVVLVITAVLMFALSFFPVHRLLDAIPHITVAVFINGVAFILIWKQGQKLWELGGLNGAVRGWEIGLALGSFVLLSA